MKQLKTEQENHMFGCSKGWHSHMGFLIIFILFFTVFSLKTVVTCNFEKIEIVFLYSAIDLFVTFCRFKKLKAVRK